MESCVQYENDVIKSIEDKRLYRGLTLPNQLRVLLISDPETDKSAASLTVGIGHLSDPDNLPGLAHFCEHMLFLGSKKYPIENDYKKFLSEHGGASNAFTSTDKTLYFFDVVSEHLPGALDRFAQFFVCPLMTESAVEREVNAVNSEHEKNLANDDWRLMQLRRSASKNGHPFGKFGTGNKITLLNLPQERGMDVRKELLNFHEKWYSANIMFLVVLGKENLEDLEGIVIPLFSEVANKNAIRPEWTDHPYGPDQVQTQTNVVPVKDLKKLKMSFPIPDLRKYDKAKPFRYLGHLVGHEGPGSLLSALKAKSWANSLMAYDERSAKGFDFFSILVDLTNDGVEKIHEILTLVFQYLNILRENGAQKWIFEECKRISETDFRFQDKINPADYVVQLARYSQDYDYPVKEMLVGPCLIQEWKPDLIDMLLSDYLKPSNVVVTVVGQKFDSIANDVEQWYGTKYRLKKLSEDIVLKWENCGINDEFKLPDRNEFIPSNFDIFCDKKSGAHPVIIHENDFTRVWLKQDDKFLLPKADLKIEFFNPLTSFDPLSHTLTNIFIILLKDALNECTYNATLAGLFHIISVTVDGFVLNLSGYNDKQYVLLDMILCKLMDFKIDPQRFEVLKEKFIRDLKNFRAVEPYRQAEYYLYWLLTEKVWTNEEVLNAATQIKIEHLKEFIPRFLSKLYVECLVHGNVDEEHVHSLIKIMEQKLISNITQPLLAKELLRNREIKLNDGSHLVQEVPNPFHKSSCTEAYYQCCPLTIKNNALMELLLQIVKEPCFSTLRTKEQLGYVVWSHLRTSNSAQGMRITVQSDKHPSFVDERIEAFLVQIRETIENMSEKEFQRNKEALAAKRLEKPKKLSQLSAKFWDEIFYRQYNFNRDEIEVGCLRVLSKDNLMEFFDGYIKNGAPERSKLSVHIISQEEGVAGTLSTSVGNRVATQKIKDVTQFKRSHGLYPLVEPYVDITTLKVKEKGNETD